MQPAATIEEASTPGASAVAVVDTGVPKPSMELEAKRVLERWDAAYNAHNASGVASQYGPSVRYFGATLTREACQEKIAAYIAKNPDQTQSSALESVTVVPDGIRVRFTKTLTTAGKAKTYASYFHLQNSMAGGLRIDEESDPVTDKNLSIGTCEDALATLARVTDSVTQTGLQSDVTHDGTKWEAHFYRSHGTSDIYFDSKTGVVAWATTGDDSREVLDESSPKWSPRVHTLVDAVKAKCK